MNELTQPTSTSFDTEETTRKTTKNTQQFQTPAGYTFIATHPIWVLDKNVSINLGKIRGILRQDIEQGFLQTLSYYARSMSSWHTRNIYEFFWGMIHKTGAKVINPPMLINYRATLGRHTEWRLGTIRGFLYKWYDLGHPGISSDIIDLLNSWTLKGNIKGDAVKRLNPTEGPLTDIELLAFNEGAARAFEQGLISITDLSISLLTSHTGRRPKQIAYIKICDLDGTKKNKKGEPMYLVNIPRAKQRGEVFRDSLKTFAITEELWVVLDAQQKLSTESIERTLGFKLHPKDRILLPLFPDLAAFEGIASADQLRPLLETDRLHRQSKAVTNTLRQVVKSARCYSERTGDLLEIAATRFRYTTGTRAAREGFGPMVIAELLDHTDIQNARVYIKNIPDHAAALDKAVANQLAPYAKAFQGTLVDREADARRSTDPNSRIRHQGEGTGTCGSYGYCGANVPIPCYSCLHFQPWLDAPHEIIHAHLLEERERIFAITGDAVVAAANDKTILAVAQVIQQCQSRREEIARPKDNNG